MIRKQIKTILNGSAHALSIFACFLFGGALLLGTTPALAVPLEIQFTGVNLSYDGNTISDAGSAAGGSGDPADADPLDTMQFKVGGVMQGSILSSDISLDVSIPDVTGISNITSSTVVTTPGSAGYFDLLIGTTPSAAEFLRLDTSAVTVSYINTTSTVQFVFGAAIAAIDAQNLPFGLQITDPVTVSFSTQVDVGSKTSNLQDIVTGFTSFGTGEVLGTFVPEPSSCVLATMGLAASCGLRRRRR